MFSRDLSFYYSSTDAANSVKGLPTFLRDLSKTTLLISSGLHNSERSKCQSTNINLPWAAVYFVSFRSNLEEILERQLSEEQRTGFCNIFSDQKSRTGLKPMQPMRLHWAPRLWGPRAMVFGQVVHFCQILLELKVCRNGL